VDRNERERDELRRFTRRDALKGALAGGLVLGGGGILAACGGDDEPGAVGTTGAGQGTPKRGGVLRVGVSGGSTSDTLDAHNPLVDTDIARAYQLYEPLAVRDANYELELLLAESIEPGTSADKWTVRLKPDLVFHNGEPVTADAVVYSIRRIIDPDDPKRGAAALAGLSADRIRKVDDLTVEFMLSEPNAEFPSALGEYYNGIVPPDYDPENPVGAGPFKYESFTPGEQSEFVRNENYWRTGQPYVDSVVIVDIGEDTARVNALLGGQVEAINNLPFSQIAGVEGNNELALLSAETGNWTPLVMRVDAPPFDDARVRQAFRLIVDRTQIAEQVFGGQAQPANDLFARYDACYNSGLEQREQDIEQAQSLLAQAGRADLTVELTTSNLTLGIVETAQVFAEQAKAAGVTVNLRNVDPGVFYGDDWLTYPFTQDYWYMRYYLGQVSQSMLPSSPYNETHWENAQYQTLYQNALAELDEAKRCELIHEMQRMEWEEGGYIIPTFNNQVDAHSAKVEGFVPAKTGGPLGNYGFRQVYFA
jgi:peptide/nickel transport system substrate-binding protein